MLILLFAELLPNFFSSGLAHNILERKTGIFFERRGLIFALAGMNTFTFVICGVKLS